MRTSDSSHASELPGGRADGFTLLELLVVLALMGFGAALVAPRLERTYDAVVASGQRADLVSEIERLPVRVRQTGRDLEITPGGPTALSAWIAVPQGWTVALEGPLRVSFNGICERAMLKVISPSGPERWSLLAPACEVNDDAP